MYTSGHRTDGILTVVKNERPGSCWTNYDYRTGKELPDASGYDRRDDVSLFSHRSDHGYKNGASTFPIKTINWRFLPSQGLLRAGASKRQHLLTFSFKMK